LNGAAASSASRPVIIAAHPYRRDRAAQKTIAAKFFLLASSIGAIAAALDYVYNRRALIVIFPRKGTAR
jgi:hypothetical protein